MSSIFEARFPGRCEACDRRIKIGEMIMYDEDDELVHARCDDVSLDKVDLAKVCPACWTVHAGECA